MNDGYEARRSQRVAKTSSLADVEEHLRRIVADSAHSLYGDRKSLLRLKEESPPDPGDGAPFPPRGGNTRSVIDPPPLVKMMRALH